jgi:hypothetical protein
MIPFFVTMTNGEPARAHIKAQSLVGFNASLNFIRQAMSRTYPLMVTVVLLLDVRLAL